MTGVHPTAIVEDGARLGAGVTIGAFSTVGPEVTLGDGVTVDSHAIVRGRTSVGARTRIGPHVFIGGDPQDLSYQGEDTGVTIGTDCVIREHSTVNRGTARGRGLTSIGDHCFMMIGAHVAHDCIVADHVILTNNTLLGGHSEIGEYAILGGASAVQQRTRVGAHCFIGGLVGVTSEVVPYAMVIGHRGEIVGVNVRGLSRRGFDRPAIHAVRSAFKLFFGSTGPRAQRIAALEARFGDVPAVQTMIDFLHGVGERPLTLPRKNGGPADDADS